MGSIPINKETYKIKYFQICEQRQRELEKCEVALLKARESLTGGNALDSVNAALDFVFDL